ncbi:MAG TPA: quinone oxidoreductase [Casimicrobiaceae bacterium]|nr:quinone oxidoreductase [Casimicrobiaceae bacterium]
MHAIAIDRFGGPDVLAVRDIALPAPQAGEVRVRVAFAGVNYIDVYMRNGTYARSATYRTPLPMVLGMEGAGTVDAVGRDVRDLAVGQRVAWCIVRGAYAQYAIVPAWKLVPVPDAIPLDIACALMLQGSTAHYLTHSAYPLAAADTCLVHAGAGGVGQLLIQLAKGRGARVLATTGSREKADIARERGADEVILYRDTDFRDAVMRSTNGRGVDVVYDSVGRDTIARSIRSLRGRGLCVLFGASSGSVEAVSPLELAEAGSVFFTRPHLADYLRDAQEVRQRANDLFAACRNGSLTVAIDRILPLADAADAHRLLESRATRGKLLLALDD